MLKKCQCLAGYFLNPQNKTCEKCLCRVHSKCFKSREDCNDQPYIDLSLPVNNTVANSVCVTKSPEGKTYMLLADGQYLSQFELDLRKLRNHTKLVKQQLWAFAESEPGLTKITC